MADLSAEILLTLDSAFFFFLVKISGHCMGSHQINSPDHVQNHRPHNLKFRAQIACEYEGKVAKINSLEREPSTNTRAH